MRKIYLSLSFSSPHSVRMGSRMFLPNKIIFSSLPFLEKVGNFTSSALVGVEYELLKCFALCIYLVIARAYLRLDILSDYNSIGSFLQRIYAM